MTTERTPTGPELAYLTEGPVPDVARDRAQSMLDQLSDIAPRPIIFGRVKAKVDEERDPDEQAIVQATADVSGRIIRAEASAPTIRQAMGIVESRLERRLTRLAERRQDANKRPPSTPAGQWRSGDLPSQRPDYYDRPTEERRVIRRKTYAPDEDVSVGEALFDLDILDYRFFLFTDEADAKPSIVYEDEEGVALRKIDGSVPPEGEVRVEVRVNEAPAPRIAIDNAIERLNVSDEPFIFFEDEDTDRASVLYRRYDGHYGLVSPSESEG